MSDSVAHGREGVELLRRMKLIRAVEEGIAARYHENKMRCPTHLSSGQEGPAAAVCLAVDSGDQAVSSHRAHAHYIAKGGDVRAMLAEIYGKREGCSRGKGGSMHLIDLAAGFYGSTAIVGNSIPIGVGLALANQRLHNQKITCVFFGDGAAEEGTFHESLNFAALMKLPVLFVCENNFFSVYSPLSVRQPEGRPIWGIAAAHSLKVSYGNGNDAWAAYQLAKELVRHVRAGLGPAFLELETYRWREHCGPNFDDELGYRNGDEAARWMKRDPIVLLADQLQEAGVRVSDLEAVDNAVKTKVEDAFRFAEEAPFPAPQEAFTDLFAEADYWHQLSLSLKPLMMLYSKP